MMKIQQTGFDFGLNPDYRLDNFYVEEDIISPLDILLRPKTWGTYHLIITGESSCGKTHLANIYANKFNVSIIDGNCLNMDNLEILASTGCVVDNISDVDEVSLFHLINMVNEQGTKIVITTDKVPSDMDISLPDLKSRLVQAMCISLSLPSDSTLRFILLKHFMDRNLRIKSDVISYIVLRMPRSYEGIKLLVKSIDDVALSQKAEITVPFVRSVIKKFSYFDTNLLINIKSVI